MADYPQDVAQLDDLISNPRPELARSLVGAGRIGVLGAGGKMGFHLCLMLQRLQKTGALNSTVTAVSRFGNPETIRRFAARDIDVIAADLCCQEDLNHLPDFDTVFFLAGVKFGTGDDSALLHQVNSELPAAVTTRYPNARFVALSSGCVYSFASVNSRGSAEDSPTDPPGAYASSCLDRERAFFRAAEIFGTRSSLIRLNYSIDLRYGVLHDIGHRVLAGQPINLTTGHVNVIWQGDALNHVIRSLELASAPPFVVNVTGKEVLSVRELAEAFGQEFDCAVRFTGLEEDSCWLSDASMAHEKFGKPLVSVQEMVAWTAEWLKSGNPSLGKPTHFEVRDGRY